MEGEGNVTMGSNCLHCNVYSNSVHYLTGNDTICNDCLLRRASQDVTNLNKKYKD